MKITIAVLFAAMTAFAQSDKAAAEYFKAQTDVATAEILHSKTMDNIRAAIETDTKRLLDTKNNLAIRYNELAASCPKDYELDLAELNQQNIKCVPVKKEAPKAEAK